MSLEFYPFLPVTDVGFIGTHPELLHTYLELDKRRERRVALAELKRKRDIDLAAVTRTNDEDAVWSWWMVSVSLSPLSATNNSFTYRFKKTPFNPIS